MRWAIIIPLVLYLGVMLAIGVWAYQRRRGRSRRTRPHSTTWVDGPGWFVLVFTLLASAASAGTFIGGPGARLLGRLWLGARVDLPGSHCVRGARPAGEEIRHLEPQARPRNGYGLPQTIRYEHPVVVIVSSVGVVFFLVAYMVPQFVGGTRVLQAVTGVEYNTLLITFSAWSCCTPRSEGFWPMQSATRSRESDASRWRGHLGRLAYGNRRTGPVNETVTEVNPDLFTCPAWRASPRT